MTKDSKNSDKLSDAQDIESESGSMMYSVNKLSAILCPAACALLLVCVFAAAFIVSRFAWDRYDAYCTRKYDFAKLYVFPEANITLHVVQQSTPPPLLH